MVRILGLIWCRWQFNPTNTLLWVKISIQLSICYISYKCGYPTMQCTLALCYAKKSQKERYPNDFPGTDSDKIILYWIAYFQIILLKLKYICKLQDCRSRMSAHSLCASDGISFKSEITCICESIQLYVVFFFVNHKVLSWKPLIFPLTNTASASQDCIFINQILPKSILAEVTIWILS